MKNFDLSLSKKYLTVNSKKYELKINNSLILGDCIGSISSDSTLNSKDTIKKLFICQSSSELFEVLLNSIGKFYLCNLIDGKYLNIYISMSAPSLFYCYDKKNEIIYLSNNEFLFYEKKASINLIEENEIYSHIFSQQLTIRQPFNSLFKNIKKVPAGCYLKINIEKLAISTHLYIDELLYKQKKITYNLFKDRIQKTTNLIVNYYKKENINLYLSGGIDSTILYLATDEKLRKFLKCYNVPYGKKNNEILDICNAFSKLIKVKVNPVRKKKSLSEREYKKIINSGIALMFNFESLKYLNINNKKSNFISGQNADTIYFIDTYSPSTRFIGIRRKILILYSSFKRLKHLPLLYELEYFLSKFGFKSKFTPYIESQIGSEEEHPVPKFNYFNKSKFETYKIKNTLDEVKILIQKKTMFKEFKSLNYRIRYLLIKIIRWYRTVHNSYSNYQLSFLFTNINRILIYSEGPIASVLLRYRLNFFDLFLIKRFSYRFFKEKTNVSFFLNLKNHLKLKNIFFSVFNRLFFKSKKHKEIEVEKFDLQLIKYLINDLSSLTLTKYLSTGYRKKVNLLIQVLKVSKNENMEPRFQSKILKLATINNLLRRIEGR